TVFPIGTTVVTWTIKDAAGNTSTCPQKVTVTDDIAPIVVTCSSPVSVTSDMGLCTATNINLGAIPIVTDNCNLTEVFMTNDAPAAFPIGTTVVTWTIKDAAGNTSTCPQNVTVTDDKAPIVVACAASVSVTSDMGLCTA